MTTATEKSPRRYTRPGRAGTPLLVMVVSLLLAFLAAQRIAATTRDRDRLRFESLVQRTQTDIVDRIDTYIALMHSTRGLMEANDSIGLRDFRTFISSIGLTARYPGIQGIGYSRRVAAADLPSFLSRTRREAGGGFNIRPTQPRDEYHVIVYLEPLDRRNVTAIGYDMFTEPVRRTVMERARDTGLPAATGSVTLIQEIDEQKQSGFLIYLPVYRGGGTPGTVAERRAQLVGFIYCPFRADDLLRGIFGAQGNPELAFQVYAGQEPATEGLLHESDLEGDSDSHAPAFTRTTSFLVAGQPWSIAFATRPAFDAGSTRDAVVLILIAGVVVSLTLFGLTWAQVNARARAERAVAGLRRSEQALAENQERMRLILAHALDAVVTMDGQGRITSWNPRAETLFGWSGEDVVGRSLADTIIPPPLREPHRRGLARYLATGEGPVLNRRIEVMAVRRDGSEFPVELAITPLGSTSGDVSFSAFLSDITARKRAEEELQRTHNELELRVADRTAELATANRDLAEQSRRASVANRFKSEFLANMSHELRTPLNAIIGFTKLMQAGKAGTVSAEQVEFLQDILTSSQHLLQLVNDILDLARVEAGKIEFRPEVLDLNKVVREVRDIVRELAAARRIQIDVTIDSDVSSVVLDPGRLKQVLYNFLSNAIKFTNEDGKVSIRARADGPAHFRLEVEDTGIGIRPEDVRRLFIEFQQLDTAAAKRYQGTGLGLALTRQLVEAQGGTVGVTSEPGHGSVFYAVLPRVGGTAVSADTQSHAATRQPGGPVVLVVEDDAIDRKWLVRTLSEAGIGAEVAATGKDAITLVRTRHYDAITVDLLLPDIQGHTVIQAIREEGPNRDTPIIVVTVLAERGLGLGFRVHDVLSKPVRPDELVAALHRVGVPRDGSQPILIVDDDPHALKLAQTVLEDFGYRSICRSDSESGLQAALQERPAAIVLDLLMPGMNGFEFLQRFRSSPDARGVPVIIWSVADLTKAELERIMSLAQGVVPKGQGAQVLLDELRAFMAPPTRVAAGAEAGTA